jgi:hypothetical protein
MRQSLLHSNDKSDIISLISKEARKNKTERDIKVPFEEWGNDENIKIYITGQRVVNDTFYKLICDGEVCMDKPNLLGLQDSISARK